MRWHSRSSRLVAAGVVGLVAAAWGGIIPFVGPAFGFSGDGTGSWHWDLAHSLLALIPGAAGCLAAITIMGFGLSRRKLFGLGLAGLVAALAGAWFVIGPFAWPVLYSDRAYFVTASPLLSLGYRIGYALGPGVLLAIVGGVAWGAAEERTTDVATTGVGATGAATADSSASVTPITPDVAADRSRSDPTDRANTEPSSTATTTADPASGSAEPAADRPAVSRMDPVQGARPVPEAPLPGPEGSTEG